jgi:uncharacterized protein (TIGR03067 family)
MRKLLTIVCVDLLVPLGVGRAQEDAVKKERERFQGTWQVVSSEEDGQATPAFLVEKLKIVVKEDQLTLEGVQELADQFGTVRMTIDPAKNPKNHRPQGRVRHGKRQNLRWHLRVER